jgi:hypothetical protein
MDNGVNIIIIIIIIINNNNNKTVVTGQQESLRLYLSNKPCKHEIKVIQKTAILCTAHILREVLM